MALKFLNRYGRGALSDAVEAINYAVTEGADILSNSWGTYAYSYALQDVIDYAYSEGVFIVAAAGNENIQYPLYPASYDYVISVSATNSSDERAPFSNYGYLIDVAAPGVDILSLRAGGASMGNPLDRYTTYASGTSMSCPHVAGVLALAHSVFPAMTPLQAIQLIRFSADDIGGTGWDEIFGYGRLNAYNAVQLANNDGDRICEAYITFPKNDNITSQTISILGTAVGSDFQSYTLDISNDLEHWNEIISSYGPVTNGELASITLQDTYQGVNYLRLTVENNSGVEFKDYTRFEVDKVHITHPLNRGYVSRGVTTIKGTAIGAAQDPFIRYTLQYRYGNPPGQWKDEGIILKNGGASEVFEDELATWNLSQSEIPDLSKVELKLEVETENNIYLEQIELTHDALMREGWPKYIGADVVRGMGIPWFYDFDRLCFGDVNGDGVQEAVYAESGRENATDENSRIYVYDTAGTIIAQWDIEGYPYICDPAIADIDNDGSDEIVIIAIGLGWAPSGAVFRAILHVFNGDGTSISGFPIETVAAETGFSFNGYPIVTDLDNDGVAEIITKLAMCEEYESEDFRWQIRIYNTDGTCIREWDVPHALDYNTSQDIDALNISIGDIDGDKDKEIILSNGRVKPYLDRIVYIYHHDGTEGPMWPVSETMYTWTRPTLGDIDGDGCDELVFLAKTPGGGLNDIEICVKNADGSNVPGWPYLLGYRLFTYDMKEVAIADFGEDVGKSIVFFTAGEQNDPPPGKVWAFHGDGTLFNGFPVSLVASSNHGAFAISPPTIADIDADDVPEIIGPVCEYYKLNQETNVREFRIWAINIDGSKVNGWPRMFYRHEYPLRALSDVWASSAIFTEFGSNRLLNMGLHFLFFTSEGINDAYLFMWDLDTQIRNRAFQWPVYRGNFGRTGCYELPPPPESPSDLMAKTTSHDEIDLTWSDNSGNEDGFKIERRIAKEWIAYPEDGKTIYPPLGWEEIAIVGANITFYKDKGLKSDTAYEYRVCAYNKAGNSDYSNIARAKTLPKPITALYALHAKAVSSSQIDLTWEYEQENYDPVKDFGFKIERRPAVKNDYNRRWKEIARVSGYTTSYSDTGLTSDTTYEYRVRAYNIGGNSDYSNIASATTLPGSTTPIESFEKDWGKWMPDHDDRAPLFIIERSPGREMVWII